MMRVLRSDRARQRQPAVDKRLAHWSIWQWKILKLCKIRHGCRFLPNNEDGRCLLVALLRLGLSDDSAVHMALWPLEPPELRKLRRVARRVRWKELGDVLGRILRLTYDERLEAKLFFLWPVDVSREEVQDRQRVRNLERRREKRRQKKGEREMMRKNGSRREVLMALLTDSWSSVPELAKAAGAYEAFRRPDGKAIGISWNSPRITASGSMRSVSPGPTGGLRVVVHRWIDKLEVEGLVETELRPGIRGQVRYARRKTDVKTGVKTERNN